MPSYNPQEFSFEFTIKVLNCKCLKILPELVMDEYQELMENKWGHGCFKKISMYRLKMSPIGDLLSEPKIYRTRFPSLNFFSGFYLRLYGA